MSEHTVTADERQLLDLARRMGPHEAVATLAAEPGTARRGGRQSGFRSEPGHLGTAGKHYPPLAPPAYTGRVGIRRSP